MGELLCKNANCWTLSDLVSYVGCASLMFLVTVVEAVDGDTLWLRFFVHHIFTTKECNEKGRHLQFFGANSLSFGGGGRSFLIAIPCFSLWA